MFLFLRRLKQNPLISDKLRKYPLYAFGGMLLVISGILLALQIDNWNTERQQEAMLKSYLQSMRREFVHSRLRSGSALPPPGMDKQRRKQQHQSRVWTNTPSGSEK